MWGRKSLYAPRMARAIARKSEGSKPGGGVRCMGRKAIVSEVERRARARQGHSLADLCNVCLSRNDAVDSRAPGAESKTKRGSVFSAVLSHVSALNPRLNSQLALRIICEADAPLHPPDQTENIPHHTPTNHRFHLFHLHPAPPQRNSETIPIQTTLAVNINRLVFRAPTLPTEHPFHSERPFFVNFQAKDRHERDST